MSKQTKIEIIRSDTEWVMSTEQGRRWVWTVLSFCGVYHDFSGTKDELLKQVGKRQIGLYLMGIISDASEELLFRMMREAKNQAEEEEYEHRKQRASDSDTGNSDSRDKGFTDLDDLIGDFDTYSSGSGPAI